MALHLARRLSPIADIPHSLALSGVVYSSLTPSKTGLIFWRYEDEGNKEPQFLAAVPVGQTFDWPTNLTGRKVRLFMISVTAAGVPTTKRITEGVQVVFDPGAAAVGPEDLVIAGETIVVNDLLYLYLDAGITKAKKADADDATKPCHAFAVTAASTSDEVRIFLSGNTMTDLTGRTPGAIQYLSTTAGQMTETPPSTAGNLKQQIGVATSSTVVNFNPLTGSIVPGTPPDEGLPPSTLLLTDLGAFSGSEHVKLDWTNNGGVGDNIIERNLDGAGYTTLTTVSSSTATYTDTTAVIASGGLLVQYRVRNASVDGYSNEVGINDAGTPPDGLTVSKILISDCDWQVHLEWGAGSGSGNYTLESRIGTGGGWSAVDSAIAATSFDDEQLGISINFTVHYRVKQNDVTGYSNEVSVIIPRCLS